MAKNIPNALAMTMEITLEAVLDPVEDPEDGIGASGRGAEDPNAFDEGDGVGDNGITLAMGPKDGEGVKGGEATDGPSLPDTVKVPFPSTCAGDPAVP